ncbi:hypothetical protein INT82_15715 [Mannheimia haemolytica]|nr:hypothetical protein [Mannheimia haemolytica]
MKEMTPASYIGYAVELVDKLYLTERPLASGLFANYLQKRKYETGKQTQKDH